MLEIKLSGDIYTNPVGHYTLLNFYNEAKKHSNEEIFINMYNLKWLDANLSAFFYAIIYYLSKTNNLSFVTDYQLIKDKFDVLNRNGFIRTEGPTTDCRKSTIPFGQFDCKNKDFIRYLLDELLPHRALKKIPKHQKDRIEVDLTELYTNVNLHSKTTEPFFVCGQLYTNKNYSIFSIVDLGVGFLPAIQKATLGKINKDKDAIFWALKSGNSTRVQVDGVSTSLGGVGLTSIFDYCKSNNGRIQILTGNCFFDANYLDNPKAIPETFVLNNSIGTVVNLFFKYE